MRLAYCLLGVLFLWAPPAASAQALPAQVLGAGGETSSNATTRLQHTLGQLAVAPAANASTGLASGFWPQVAGAGALQPPAVPALTSPTDGQQDVTTPVSLDWSPIANATSYDVQVSLSPDFSTLLLDARGLEAPPYDVASLEGATTHYWRVRAINAAGASPFAAAYSFVTAPAVSTEDAAGVPEAFALHEPYPNPSRHRAMLRYDVPVPGRVVLVLYDALGREIVRVVDAERPAGRHTTVVDGTALRSGVYLLRMTASGGFVQTQRLTLAR